MLLRTFPLYEATVEPEIKDSMETIANPFEESASIILSAGKRKPKDRSIKYQNKNPEIDEAICRFGEENVHIRQDSDT